MQAISCRRHVDAPIDRVFAAASDFANGPAYMKGIVRVRMLTDGPLRVGTRFEATRGGSNREYTQTMEVTELDAPNRYVLGAAGCGCRIRSELLFSSRDGGTDVEMRFDATPLSLPAKILLFVVRPLMGKITKAFAKDLDDLAAHCEGR
jgi:uncharacterized membrane protein